MEKLLNCVQKFFKDHGSTILTVIGGIGVVTTVVLAVKETPKAESLLVEAEIDKGEMLTIPEKVKTVATTYIPATVSGVGTLLCIFGANVLNKKQQASLLGASMFIGNSYKKYKDQIRQIYGKEADKYISEKMAKDRYSETPSDELEGETMLFYNKFSDEYFEATMTDVLNAEYLINRAISVDGDVGLSEFYKYLHIDETEYGDIIRWSLDSLFEDTGVPWLDFEHDIVTMDDGLECCILSFSSDPCIQK